MGPFDSNCLVGQHSRFQVGGFTSASRLREEMAHYDMAEALVHHALTKEQHLIAGNQRLLERIQAGR